MLLTAAGLLLLAAAYATVDWLIRRKAAVASVCWVWQRLSRWPCVAARRDGVTAEDTIAGQVESQLIPLLSVALCALGSVSLVWPPLPGAPVRSLCFSLLLMLVWSAVTRDQDPVTHRPALAQRAALLLTTVLAYYSPLGLFAALLLLTTPFGHWQHHATLPMRLLQSCAALVLLQTLLGPGSLASLRELLPAMPVPAEQALAALFVQWLLIVVSSHYLMSGLAKGWLGRRWHSWASSNRLHYLAANAYSWGWARFVSEPQWMRVVAGIRQVERPLCWFAFGLEVLFPLALLDQRLAVVLCLLGAAFHVGVFVCSGLLFWEWILTDLLVAALLWQLPRELATLAMNPAAMGVGLAFLLAFPLRHKLWKPMPLGWFDSPLTQRIHWQVVGQSGKLYGLYNNFMCPHERLYGKVHGCFMAPQPVLTYHLGEVFRMELRDALVESRGNRERLQQLREAYGIRPLSTTLTAQHKAYLVHFFEALNSGACKALLPHWLRWLKAPGGQLFYWGQLPAYRRQEPVVEVRWRYTEQFFDGRRLVALYDEEVARQAIAPLQRSVRSPRSSGELTPKELDTFLLGHALGRLVLLPASAAGYMGSDDGRR